MEVQSIASLDADRIKKVAAYARVSTLEEEQSYSYDSQKEYYEAVIKANPKWEFAGLYADQGISGTTKNRPGFQQMIKDAKLGLIDIVLVKSISRFARNAVDTQNIVHDLKAHNVEVYFDEQKISSFNRNAEMMLNMMAVVAEHESKSISQNTRWAYQKLAEQGIRHLGNNKVFGYDEIDGELVPNDNAEYVKIIFQMYAEGSTYREIGERLEELGAKPMKGEKFTAGSLRYLLGNELYCGDMRIQKQPHVNWHTKKPDPSIPYTTYYVEEHHKPIVSKELWEKAKARLDAKQEEVDRGIYRNSRSHFLFGRIYCGECGEQMRRITYGVNRSRRKVWKCYGRTSGNGCENDVVNEDELFEFLCCEQCVAWDGVENMDPEDFKDIERIDVFADGRIEITRKSTGINRNGK